MTEPIVFRKPHKVYVLNVDAQEEHYAQLAEEDVKQIIHEAVVHGNGDKLLYGQTSNWSCDDTCSSIVTTQNNNNKRYRPKCLCAEEIADISVETGAFSTMEDATEAIRLLTRSEGYRPMNVTYAVLASEIDGIIACSYKCSTSTCSELESHPIESYAALTKSQKQSRARWNTCYLEKVTPDGDNTELIYDLKESMYETLLAIPEVKEVGLTMKEVPHLQLYIVLHKACADPALLNDTKQKCETAINATYFGDSYFTVARE